MDQQAIDKALLDKYEEQMHWKLRSADKPRSNPYIFASAKADAYLDALALVRGTTPRLLRNQLNAEVTP